MSRALRHDEAAAILAAHGLVPGPGGFAAADLVAFAVGRGWAARAERTAARGPTRRWRATVAVSLAGATPPRVLLGGATRSGATEAEALALALATVLRREG